MTKAFISYSRKDKELVSRLHKALKEQQLETWVDWEGIPPSAVWLQEIYSAIDGADAFVFVISPDSVASRVCNQELQHAVQQNKRIIPVVSRAIEDRSSVSADLTRLNWIYCRDRDDFTTAIDMLVQAIHTDLQSLKMHTRLLVRAVEWESKARDNSFLLRGTDLKEAEAWLAQVETGSRKELAPTQLHTYYIATSRKAHAMPMGTVTFLLAEADAIGSEVGSKSNEQISSNNLVSAAIEAHGGYIFEAKDAAIYSAFPTAHDATDAALAVQRTLGEPLVRIALHSGVAEERDGRYFGHHIARIECLLAAGHAGQILLSLSAQELVQDALPDEIGLRDMGEHRLKDLTRAERIFQVVTPDLPSDFPPLETLGNRPNNLPVQPSSLVGREKEITAAKQLLMQDKIRLVTFTGPGGMGKTRLSLQIAADLLEQFQNGVFFVNLAPVSDEHLVVPEIAQALGVREAGGQPLIEALKDYLRDKKMLLVLDNFEHVLGAAGVVGKLLEASTALKVLVTSRTRLQIRGEHEYQVPPLQLPGDLKHLPPVEQLIAFEAIRLFAERATELKPNFLLDEENAPAVAEICFRLDGLPLAIELAAARIKILAPAAMLLRLQSRLKLLTGGARDVPERQRTLRGAIEWSHDLLDDGEKQLFRRLAVFVGGRTLEAVEEICNAEGDLEVDVLDGLSSLVDKSLLRQEEGAGGEPRFVMLETIHEYAREKLQKSGEAEALHKEHALYFVKLTEQAEPHLTSAGQQEWLNRLEDEHDNIRAALRWIEENGETENVQIGLRTVGAIWRFWLVRGYYNEGRERIQRLLSATTSNGSNHPRYPESKAKALSGAGSLAYEQGDYPAARSLHEESLAIRREIGDKNGIALSLNNLGMVSYQQGNPFATRSLLEESLAIMREIGDKNGIARSLSNLGVLSEMHGDYSAARSLHEESLAIRREIGDKNGITFALSGLGNVALGQGDYSVARSLFEESLAIQREIGDKSGIAYSLLGLGNVALGQGDYSVAHSLLEESLAIMREISDLWGSAHSLMNMGIAFFMQGDNTAARSLFEESLAIRREIGDKSGIASSLNNLGMVSFQQGDYSAARSLHEESLAIMTELENKSGIACGLAGLGEVATELDQPEKGARLLGAAVALLEAIGVVMEPIDRVQYERAMASARSQLGEEMFKNAWVDGRSMRMEEAVTCARE